MFKNITVMLNEQQLSEVAFLKDPRRPPQGPSVGADRGILTLPPPLLLRHPTIRQCLPASWK
jgi:hypothetical protein